MQGIWVPTERKHAFIHKFQLSNSLSVRCGRKQILFLQNLLKKLNERQEIGIKAYFRILSEATLFSLLQSVSWLRSAITNCTLNCSLCIFSTHTVTLSSISQVTESSTIVFRNCRIRVQSRLSLNAYLSLINKWFISFLLHSAGSDLFNAKDP